MAKATEHKKRPVSPKKWQDIIRRYVVEGESASALAREIGVTEGAIRSRASTKKYEVKELANQIVTAERKYEAYDKPTKDLVDDMVSQLRAISSNLTRAAVSSSNTSARLAAIAEKQSLKIDTENPMDTQEELQAVGALTKLSNEASTLGIALINASKRDKQEGANPDGLLTPTIIEIVPYAGSDKPTA